MAKAMRTSYGNYTVVSRTGKMVTCRCVCGNLRTMHFQTLCTGRTQSCGCIWRDGTPRVIGAKAKATLPERYIWISMIARCCNPDSSSYSNYGARGINVCDRWRDSFVAFIADVGRRPSPSHSIERIDNDGDYTPSNTRWATKAEQVRNTRRNKYVTYNGETMILTDWAARAGIGPNTLGTRLSRGWSVEDVINGRKRRQYERGPRLTLADVDAMRAASTAGMSYAAIAYKWNISSSHTSRVCRGLKWNR